jgi:galactonate dehydratase
MFNIYFFEEPIPPENTIAYKRVRENSSGVPLAAGERLFSRFDFREIVENQLIDFAQPDICHCGGITEIRKIASMVETYHIKFAPHNPNGPVATAASLQVSACAQNFDILEFASSSVYSRPEIYNIPLKPEDGCFALPQAPGLGIDLNEEAFAEYPYKFIQYEPRYTPDNTVSEI